MNILLAVCLLLGTTVWANEITGLKFLADINIPTGSMYENTEIGGLSGLFYHRQQNKLYAISDDRGARGVGSQHAPRIYLFDLVLEAEIQIKPAGVVNLQMEAAKPFIPMFLDPEGITFLPNGNMVVSSEGYVPFIPPMLLIFDADGVFESQIEVPAKYVALKNNDRQEKGILHNFGFEALTISSDQKKIYTATEMWLKQDEEVMAQNDVSIARILSYEVKDEQYVPTEEFVYPLTAGGLVDFVATGPGQLITVERGWSPVSNINTIHLYQSALNHADNVLALETITNLSTIAMVSKKLLMDLSQLKGLLSPIYPGLDNIEGITLGPRLPNGNATLILVSDNNFRAAQRTLFLIFEVIREPVPTP